MPYEHPLAYILGVEGLALLRAYTGEHDARFVEERLAEIRKLLDDDDLRPVEVTTIDTREGYRVWSATYDGPNSAFDSDEPRIDAILDTLPAGDALDAACGTGRLAARLAGRGHRVTGVDSSPEMLERARRRVPEGAFLEGDLTAIPLPDGSVDLVTCSLALTHVRDLGPVFAEFGRVLRPGGHLVISDMHPESVFRGHIPLMRLPDGRPVRVASHRHLIGDYIRAGLAAGLQVRRCEEPSSPAYADMGPAPEPSTGPGPWEGWPWSLTDLVPVASRAATADIPYLVVWQFERA
ncbi:MAG: methyltransferase domain-containing protein [Thermoactinospora sp.]|nr:methyltransferase domain-containing protein [Thermoactinospora sp.]